MSSKVMSLIGGIKDTAPLAHKAQPGPHDRPMYYRPGITMGQHLDEFAGFKDEKGHSFEQLIYSTLHSSAADPGLLLQPQRQAGNMSASLKKSVTSSPPGSRPARAIPWQEKINMDDYMKKLQYGHLDDIRKRKISDHATSQKRKRE